MMSFARLSLARLSPVLLTMLLALGHAAPHAQARPAPRTADYILAIVNQELVTANELALRVAAVGGLHGGARLRRLGARQDERPPARYQRVSA